MTTVFHKRARSATIRVHKTFVFFLFKEAFSALTSEYIDGLSESKVSEIGGKEASIWTLFNFVSADRLCCKHSIRMDYN